MSLILIGPFFLPHTMVERKHICVFFIKLNFRSFIILIITWRMWFTQYDAPPPFAVRVRKVLINVFLDRSIVLWILAR